MLKDLLQMLIWKGKRVYLAWWMHQWLIEDEGQERQIDEYHQSKVSGNTVGIIPLSSPDNQGKLLTLLCKYVDVLQDNPGLTYVLEHGIRTVSHKPIHVKNRQIPYSLEERINKEVSDMLHMTWPFLNAPIILIIHPSLSCICIQITERFVIDFRLLNNQTFFNYEPMPDAWKMFSNLAGH